MTANPGDTGWRWNAGQTLSLTGLPSLPSDDGLTDGSVDFWESELIDFTDFDNIIDMLFSIQLKSGGSSANDQAAYVYAWAGVPDGAGGYVYTEGIAASGPAARTAGKSPTSMKRIGIIPLTTLSTTYTGGPFSFASAFDGKMPERGGIAIRQYTGTTLDGTSGNFKIVAQAVYANTALS